MNQTEQPRFIDLQRARELLAQAVATQGPHFVYSPYDGAGCYYTKLVPNMAVPLEPDRLVPEGDPRTATSCLIGVVLDLAGHTFHHAQRVQSLSVCGLLNEGHITLNEISPEAVLYLNMAQKEQDDRRPWGVAYETAEQSIS